jgi:glycosyltransferase involved in cell wall biosynthesis
MIDSSPRPASAVMLTMDRRIDRRILLEADSLEEDGWQVTIVAMMLDPGDTDGDPRVVRIGGQTRIGSRNRFVLDAYRRVRQCLPMNHWLMRRIKSAAWRYAVDQEAFYLQLFSETAARFSPTVFVAHDLPMLPVASVACRHGGVKLVYDSHELYSEQEFSTREKLRWAQIETKYIHGCDAVITINPSIARELERRYGIQNVQVVYNAERTGGELPVNRRLFHEVFGLDREQKIVLFQGGLSAGRNLEVLVDALRHVRHPRVNLVILGDGQLRSALRDRVRRSGLSRRVHLHPAVSQARLIDFSASADAGVIPYQASCLNNYYCTPNKLFEFIAAGVPVIASDLPELRSIIDTHRIGRVGDMRTPETTARLIDETFQDPQQLHDWRAQLARARHIVSWEREGLKIKRIFEALR